MGALSRGRWEVAEEADSDPLSKLFFRGPEKAALPPSRRPLRPADVSEADGTMRPFIAGVVLWGGHSSARL